MQNKKLHLSHKKPTVTLAVCAFNEEKNITNFLNPVLLQKQHGFILKHIWVISDGSTDNTVKKAKAFKSSKVIVWDFKNRIGKSSRLNQIYKLLETDFLVQSDADVVFANPNVVGNIIQPLIKDKNVGMCGGNPIPIKPVTFVEKAVNSSVSAYLNLRKKVNGGDNIFSADGRLLAFKKDVVKKIKVPVDMIANDEYAYFCCLSLGFKYKFVPSAKVYFRSPQTLKDQIRQNVRFESAEARMKKYFSAELVNKETHIPRLLLLNSLFKQFLKNPLLSLFIFLVNQYCRLVAIKKEQKLNAKWQIAYTTKNI